MSAVQPDSPPPAELRQLETDLIDPNAGNPRLIFPENELDRLTESIAQEGVLVPIVVYEKGGRYILVDGERRFKCARTLGLKTIPALVTTERNEHDLLVQMFNIHLIREPWRDMPTAKALGRLIEELKAKNDPDLSDRHLANLTGLSPERINQLKFALQLPPDWQKHIEAATIPLNWFWELEKNVVRPLAKLRPGLMAELGEQSIKESFVAKRLEGVTGTDSVSLRKIRPIINFAAMDADQGGDDKTSLDLIIRKLVQDPLFTIEEAYEDSVQIMVEIDKLGRRTASMLANFDRLLSRAKSQGEKDEIRRIGNELVAGLQRLLKS